MRAQAKTLEETAKAAQSRATRRRYLDVCRKLFGERGYRATSIEDIVQATGLTRGALYHHWPGKEELFRAVLEDVEQELVQRAARIADRSPAAKPWDVLVAGVESFLAQTSDPIVQRIVILDGPSVLGYQAWREIDERYAFGTLKYVLGAAMEAGDIPRQPVEPLARVILAALNEASLVIAQAQKPRVAKREMTAAVLGLLEALRAAA
jgi:AcrR family transcriptional regulator